MEHDGVTFCFVCSPFT